MISGRAQHRPPHRLVGKGALLEIIEDDVVGRVVGLADLLQDDGALAFELGRVEGRVLQDVGEDVERERHVLLQHLGVIGRALARGIGVEVAADRLDLLGDGAGAAPLGALERHVLEKMRDAVDLRRLVPGADIDPQPERDRVHRIDAVGDDAQPVRQRREPGCHAAPLDMARRPAGARERGRSARPHRHRSGEPSIRSRLFHDFRQRRRHCRADAGGPLDRIGKFRRMRASRARPSASRVRRRPLPPGRRRPRPRYADRSAIPVRAVGFGDRVERRRVVDAVAAKTAPRAARQACSSAGSAPVSRNRRNAAATAAPLRPFSSNSRRSKLLDDLDVHAGAEARLDRRERHLAAVADSAPACRWRWCR